ncbi:hypothetical protein [Methylobacterium sp. WSM2598]|uniref:hypothetical protein n=1 Tax=Methylobacterium sp. WSM2598 TaxID=398261 RepID=UPI0003632D18|nr:hypothetical protein [Methylobacterium sp. WSM2598]
MTDHLDAAALWAACSTLLDFAREVSALVACAAIADHKFSADAAHLLGIFQRHLARAADALGTSELPPTRH